MTPFKLLKVSLLGLLGLLGLQLLVSCQLAFGDYRIDTTMLVVPCQLNATRCDGSKIEICASGSEWHLLAACSSADLCDLTTLTCRTCRPGSSQCNGPIPQTCGADLKWSSAAPCVSAELCQVPPDGSPASCQMPGCPVAGELRCSADGHLQRCPANQTEWQDVEVCASAALCNAASAKARVDAGQLATCELPSCSPGQFSCDTGSPRPCNADRNGWGSATTPCTAGSACNLLKGDCSACTAGSYSCSGGELYQCSAQQAWAGIAACNSTLSCDVAGAVPRCDPPSCTPGAFRCLLSALERCRDDGGAWELVEQCQNQRLCNPAALRCDTPRCSGVGTTRCNGNQQQRCRDDLTGWENLTLCAASGSCDPVLGCVAAACTEGDYRCNDSALERCLNQTWTWQKDCKTRAACDAPGKACTASP